jgi:hypothetical protein
MLKGPKRKVIWIPVIHTQKDLGSLSDSVKSFYVRKIGWTRWIRHVRAIKDLWQNIRREIEALGLDYSRVRIYQDGLPNCGQEEKIIRSLAKGGSENHQLVLDLMEKGATVMGTESTDLLLKEYDLARKVGQALGKNDEAAVKKEYKDRGQELLDQRDHYLAQRIDETLKGGETGLLFLGMLHAPDRYLSPDIELIFLGKKE